MGRRGVITVGAVALALLVAAIALRPRALRFSGERTWDETIPAVGGPVDAPVPTARAAFLADAETGKELFSFNPDEELPNASTTKILTASIAIEHGRLGRSVTVSKHAADAEPAHIDMKPGEKFTLKDLLYAMMLHSANDAAIAVAESVGGTEAKFMDEMNQKAQKLGCAHTHFVTPNGLNDKKHYTTARDLAAITVYALKKPFFNELIRTKQYKITRSINKKYLMMRRAHGDRFLFKYPGADGVKTGYTHPAGRCYVGSASRPDDLGSWRLISVVLRAKDTFADTESLMDYGFKAWARHEIVKSGSVIGEMAPSASRVSVSFVPIRDLSAILRTDVAHRVHYHYLVSGAAPMRSAARVGVLEVTVDNENTERIPLRLKTAVPLTAAWRHFQQARWISALLALCMLGCSFGSLAKTNRRSRTLLPPGGRRVDSARARASERAPRRPR